MAPVFTNRPQIVGKNIFLRCRNPSHNISHIGHVLYNCPASRPGIEGKTNEESRDVQTETLTVKATPLPGGMVKAKTGDATDATVYNGWYAAVYMPAAAPENGNESGEETV